MATEEEAPTTDATTRTSDFHEESCEQDGCKRKASFAKDSDDGAAKRPKHDGDKTPPRSGSPDRSQEKDHDRERRASAAKQEEKKRSKRLFGGLLNTLSQKPNNSQQQKRRQEIERRQLDKMQQQSAEDDKKRAEKRAALHEVRMEQQIAWEERVMRNRHAKELRLAQFLKTRSQPEIYYLPWRLTRKEEDIIDGQVRDCKADITRELEDFRWRKEQHLKQYGPKKESDEPRTEPAPAPAPPAMREDGTAQEQPQEQPQEPPAASPRHESAAKGAMAAIDDPHDDSGDVLVEAEEDMVIY
ncbi:hypothetical protein HIM_08457 [Hirsutella minnesotensis 3608]|uniref:Pinin/SDK/MemA protein domain-containing protein n=1 Tax=Hirsutella minnesotensis 3608 TaxID=1043627 RepID=A0A0F7ZYB7_9HYPO|nr:hypothetical protein HIM_08457 [Hirsutella minnesotensis 3608]